MGAFSVYARRYYLHVFGSLPNSCMWKAAVNMFFYYLRFGFKQVKKRESEKYHQEYDTPAVAGTCSVLHAG